MEFDVLREQTEARMVMGSGFPDEFVPIVYVQNASLSQNEKYLALANIQNTLASPAVANQMRRFFGPRGNAARQDVLFAADLETVSEKEDYAAWGAFRKAKKKRRREVAIGVKPGGAKIGRRPHSEQPRTKNRGSQ